VYYARIEAHADARPVSNIMTWTINHTPATPLEDTGYAQQLAAQIANEWPTIANDLLASVYVGEQVAVYPLGSPLVPAQLHALVAPGGRVPTARHFLQVAGLIKHTVIRRGKGSQGRTFLSPLADIDISVNGDQMNAPWIANAQSDWTAMINHITTNLGTITGFTWQYAQLHKKAPGATFPIFSSTAETLITSSRRRLGR
jgi:hypothetical protein